MKKLLLKGSLALLLLQLCFSSYAQTLAQPLVTEDIINRIAFVYGNEFVTNNPTLVTAYGEMMVNRIEYRSAPQDANEKYPLLSSYPVYNKVNASIQGADFGNFDIQQFNPLMYNLEFFANLTQIIRIDGTDYLMIIHPVKRN